MASPFRDNPYRRPNFAADGTIPGYLTRPQIPPIPPIFRTRPAPWPDPPTVPGPFPVPVPQTRAPHEVDPSERNPYNDPEPNPRGDPAWDPNFLVTGNQSLQEGAAPGCLLGRLLSVLAKQAEGAPNNYGKGSAGAPSVAKTDAVAPEESHAEQNPIRILGRRVVRY